MDRFDTILRDAKPKGNPEVGFADRTMRRITRPRRLGRFQLAVLGLGIMVAGLGTTLHAIANPSVNSHVNQLLQAADSIDVQMQADDTASQDQY